MRIPFLTSFLVYLKGVIKIYKKLLYFSVSKNKIIIIITVFKVG